MTCSLRKLVLCLLLGISIWGISPAPARSDQYWDNHWGWYDRAYRPYYTRRYYYGAPSSNYAPPAPYGYGTTYYGPYGTYYGPYGTAYPNTYATPYYYGGGVSIGPLHFGWW